MMDQDRGEITKKSYMDYLKATTLGLVPEYVYDESVADELWREVTECCSGAETISRADFSLFVDKIDLHLFMVIHY